ncbi:MULTISPECIES: LuxR C-terminal-related transcriptional regulator [unclassified Mycolicibacterium]|uniref:LuxR C-terminal-related transcriptional regulator n=1 Tax=unclassified Mycolicibacterium TaxID=2636767 RepID=UPI002EDAC012
MNTGHCTRVELSTREREILIAWLRTESKAAVGRALFIAPGTVATYLQRVRAKYERAGRPAPTKAALAARAIQDGYIELDDL